MFGIKVCIRTKSPHLDFMKWPLLRSRPHIDRLRAHTPFSCQVPPWQSRGGHKCTPFNRKVWQIKSTSSTSVWSWAQISALHIYDLARSSQQHRQGSRGSLSGKIRIWPSMLPPRTSHALGTLCWELAWSCLRRQGLGGKGSGNSI